MKITLLVLNSFTNDARVDKEAAALAAAGHRVIVIALWEPGLLEREIQSGYEVVRLRLRTRPWRGGLIAPIIKYLEYAARVWNFAKHNPTQVYHANDANTLPAAYLAARHTGATLVYDAHELETGRNFGNSTLAGFYRIVWAWPEKGLIHKAFAVITVNEAIADELVKLYQIDRPVVVMNCPDFHPPQSSTRLRDELGIPSNLKIALYQGRIAAGRGIEPLFDAIQELSNLAAVALGDGPQVDRFRQRVETGEWQRVYLPGKVPLKDLPEYTASADLGVVLIQAICRSYELSLPNKLFEYIQAGIPVLGSNLPEIARVIREHEIGEVVDSDNIVAITQGLRRLLADPERYQQTQANTSRAAEVFNWQNESKKLLELYRQLETNLPSLPQKLPG